MSTPITGNRPAALPTTTVADTVKHIADHTVTTTLGDLNGTVASVADGFEVAGEAASKLAKTKTGARVVGAVTGAIAQKLAPKLVENGATLGEGVAKLASKVGVSSKALETAGRWGGAALHGAGIASIAYDGIRTFADSKADTGSRLAQAGASVAVGAATMIPGVGTAVLVAELATGGGVSGAARGAVAWADAALTGDTTALNEWKQQAKDGDLGWAIKWAATGEPPKPVAAAVDMVKGAAQGVANLWNRVWN